MRKIISLLLAILFLAAIISGFAESHVHPGSAGHHTAISLIFAALIFFHVALNFKALTRYLIGSSKKAVS